MKLTAQKGFTLIELMIVIVILGILLSIGLVSYISLLDKANQAQLRANSSVLRITAMIYSIDNDYPSDNYFNLKKEAIAKKYWVKLFNPWTDKEDMGLDMNHNMSPTTTDTTFDSSSLSSPSSVSDTPASSSELLGGTVIYCGGDKSNPSTLNNYAIYAADKSNSSVLNIFMHEGKVFYLSNGR